MIEAFRLEYNYDRLSYLCAFEFGLPIRDRAWLILRDLTVTG